MPPKPPSTASIEPSPAPHSPAVPAPDAADLARQGWLRLVVARQALARCTELIEEWRLLRTGRAQRRGSWRRLAHAAASLLLVFGGLVRGIGWAWSVEAATIPFSMYTVITNFNGAFSVSHAGLDRDGDLDIIATAVNDDTVAWWENDGTPANGGWVTHTIDDAFIGAQHAVAVDLDRDGALDVLGAAQAGDDITWWENDGSPADGGWTTHTIDADFDGARDVKAHDLDGDGHLDVLAAGGLADDVTWWENDGSPANGGWTVHTIEADFDATLSADAADLDQDGDLDVLASAFTDQDITWWESDGTPTDGGWTTRTIADVFDGAAHVSASDLDRDGDLDAIGATKLADDITWWQNKGGQFTLPTTGTAPATINAGQSDDFLTIVLTHNGRTGDNDAELTTLQLRFEDTTGTPDVLTTAEANAIIADLKILVDANANGMYDAGTDTLVATVGTLALNGSGDQIVSFTDGDANLQLPFATGTRPYFAVLDLTTTYPGDPARNGVTEIRMTHITEASSTAEDRPNDLPLGMAYTASTQSSAGGTLLQGPLAVTIKLLEAEASGRDGPAGWLLRFGALGATLAAVWAALWRRRRAMPGGGARGSAGNN